MFRVHLIVAAGFIGAETRAKDLVVSPRRLASSKPQTEPPHVRARFSGRSKT